MAPLKLTLFGPPELRTAGGDLIRLRTRKHLALLIFLAVEPDIPHRRDRLASYFWPEAELSVARHSLATALSILRRVLGRAALETSRDTVRLLPGWVITDLSLLVEQESAEGLRIPGPLLEEFELPDSPDFDLWVERLRAGHLPAIRRVLGGRIERHRRRGESREIEALARLLSRIDDVTEGEMRALMEALTLDGDRYSALRAYESYDTRLRQQHGTVPSPPMAEFSDRLRRRGLPEPITGSTQGRQIFVGRGSEYERGFEVLEATRANQPAALLIKGRSGIGKTTLADRLTGAAILDGTMVARTQCYELERELPFGMLANLAAQLVELPGARATAPEQLAEIAALVPQVRLHFPTLPPPRDAPVGEMARLLFTEGLLALIEAVADERHLIIRIEDLHLADVTSLNVLHLIIRRLGQVPVMVCATLLDGTEQMSGVSRFFDSGVFEAPITLVHLGPLPQGDMAVLVDSLLEEETTSGPTIRRAILNAAQGNPMIATLLVQDWFNRGHGCMALSVEAMTSVPESPAEVLLQRIVARTISELDQEARAVGELAAILGRRMNELSFYSLLDLSPSRTMLAMSHLHDRRVFRDAETHLEFSNELVRGHCYHSMALPTRRLLHGAVADRLLSAETVPEGTTGLEVAWHLVRAGRLPEAIPWLLSGGRAAIERGAAHEADLALTTGLPALSGSHRHAAVLLLAEARQELGRWKESLNILEELRGKVDGDEAAQFIVLQASALRWLGSLSRTSGPEFTSFLFTIAEGHGDLRVRLNALASLPYLISYMNEKQLWEQLHRPIEMLSQFQLTPYQQLQLLHTKARLLAELLDHRGAREVLTRAVAIARKESIRSSIALRTYIGAGTMTFVGGKYDESVEPLVEAAAIAKEVDNVSQYGILCSSLATVMGRLGKHDEQLTWAVKASKSFHPSDFSTAAISAVYERGVAQAFLGRKMESIATANDLRAQIQRPNTPQWVYQVAGLMAADIFALNYRTRQAYATATEAIPNWATTPVTFEMVGLFSRWVALLGVRRKECQEALEALDVLRLRLNDYHAKDQAELLVSIGYLKEKLGITAPPQEQEATGSRLLALPIGIRRVLIRLELYS